MAKKVGRPRVGPDKRKQSISFSLPPPMVKKIDAWSKRHGVTRSQIAFDAFRSLEGALQEDLAHLRHELADQTAVRERLEQLVDAQQNEMSRLKSSQEIVEAVLNPYRTPEQRLNKAEKDRMRCMRLLQKRPDLVMQLKQLRDGILDGQGAVLPVLKEIRVAYGSWEAAWDAYEALKEARKE